MRGQDRRRRRLWLAALAALVAAAVLLAHLTFERWMARAIVYAPNHGKELPVGTDRTAAQRSHSGVPSELRLPVGPPRASLSVWILEPRLSDSGTAIRGTILVLHGIRDSKRTMLGFGNALAERGYRVVLPDLRGHGRSSGEWLSFGEIESRDLSQVLDELERRALATDPVSVYGASYGGATAILLGRRDPRIRSVVAVAAFASPEDAVRGYLRRIYPVWLVPDSRIDRALEGAGRIAGFDPQRDAPIERVGPDAPPLLLIHGKKDRVVSFLQSEQIHRAAKGRSRLLLLPEAGHAAVFADRDGIIFRESLQWFERWNTAPKDGRGAFAERRH